MREVQRYLRISHLFWQRGYMSKKTYTLLGGVLFSIFFGVGLAAAAASILAAEALELYMVQIKLEQTQEANLRIEKLINDYRVLISAVEQDPNILARLSTVTLGAEPEEDDVAYPKASGEQLAAAKQVTLEKIKYESGDEPAIPLWVLRCVRPWSRICLFFAGTGLVIVAFTCFGTYKEL